MVGIPDHRTCNVQTSFYYLAAHEEFCERDRGYKAESGDYQNEGKIMRVARLYRQNESLQNSDIVDYTHRHDPVLRGCG